MSCKIKRDAFERVLLTALLTALFTACSDGGTSDSADASVSATPDAGPATGGPDGSTGQPAMSWKYDGTLVVASGTNVTRHLPSAASMVDSIVIVAGTGGGIALGIELVDGMPTDGDTLIGSHPCQNDPGTFTAEITYSTTGGNLPTSCTIGLTQAGRRGTSNAIGTFEAVLADGHTITDGTFNVPVGFGD